MATAAMGREWKVFIIMRPYLVRVVFVVIGHTHPGLNMKEGQFSFADEAA